MTKLTKEDNKKIQACAAEIREVLAKHGMVLEPVIQLSIAPTVTAEEIVESSDEEKDAK